jgi:hypothetical protein|tara:strand:- start:881 stop:1123 length:243 start_codon:yes stop_codon:yes gene_type:complete
MQRKVIKAPEFESRGSIKNNHHQSHYAYTRKKQLWKIYKGGIPISDFTKCNTCKQKQQYMGNSQLIADYGSQQANKQYYP